MSKPDDDGIGFDKNGTSSDCTTKTRATQNNCRQLLCSPSSTIYIPTSKNSSALQEHQTLIDIAARCSSADADLGPRAFAIPPEIWTLVPAVGDATSISSLTNVTEAIYTAVSLEDSSRNQSITALQKSYLLNIGSQTNNASLIDLSKYFAVPEILSVNSKISVESSTLVKGKVVSEGHKDSTTMRDNLLNRMLRTVAAHRKPMLNYLLPLCLIMILVLLIYSFRDTAKSVLYWIETQNTWIIFVIFLCMFTIVSFPVTVGYLVLIIASGYLFGFIGGLLTVVIGANLGVAIAHNAIKSLQSKLPVHKLIKNETSRAILRVISGPRAFKIVLFARLTPIPFGLQNTIFGISSVNTRSYHVGTVIGLLPAQTINVYLGSKLRSIHEVLNDHNAALGLAGYGVFVVEVIVGAALMVWVIQKARLELSAALLANTDTDSDQQILIDIET